MSEINWNNQGLTTEMLIERLSELDNSNVVTRLCLDYNEITSLDKIVFPVGVEWLSLGDNKIASLPDQQMQIGGTLHVSTDNQKEYINLGLYIGVSGQQIAKYENG